MLSTFCSWFLHFQYRWDGFRMSWEVISKALEVGNGCVVCSCTQGKSKLEGVELSYIENSKCLFMWRRLSLSSSKYDSEDIWYFGNQRAGARSVWAVIYRASVNLWGRIYLPLLDLFLQRRRVFACSLGLGNPVSILPTSKGSFFMYQLLGFPLRLLYLLTALLKQPVVHKTVYHMLPLLLSF